MTPKELNAIAAKLAEQVWSHRRKSVEVVPPGWFTVKQMMASTKKSDHQVTHYLKLVGAERKDFLLERACGIRAVPHYKLK
jgi:hypothetical protein